MATTKGKAPKAAAKPKAEPKAKAAAKAPKAKAAAQPKAEPKPKAPKAAPKPRAAKAEPKALKPKAAAKAKQAQVVPPEASPPRAPPPAPASPPPALPAVPVAPASPPPAARAPVAPASPPPAPPRESAPPVAPASPPLAARPTIPDAPRAPASPPQAPRPIPPPASPPAPAPVEERPIPNFELAWRTRRVAKAQLPRGPGLAVKHKISFPSQAPDGTVLGRTRGAVADSQMVRIAPDGEQVPISEPGQLLYAAFDTDGSRVLAATADGKLLEFPSTADASQAKQRFDAGGRIWSVHPLSPTRAVVVQDRTVHLARTEGATWELLDSVSVAPITLPAVELLGCNRWVLVGRDPELHLYAVVRDRLRRVQTWRTAEATVAVHDGRPFLTTPGSELFDEVLNLDDVHAALS